jgi:hypothetical protein
MVCQRDFMNVRAPALCHVLPQDDACSSLRRNSAATATGIQIASAMVGDKPRGVSIEGRVNVDTSGEVRRMIAEVLHSIPPAITVDFYGVTYLDSSGLATCWRRGASRASKAPGWSWQVCTINPVNCSTLPRSIA